ncbi:MAG: hypothetical protein ACYTG4_05735 [Planctomycetota bacterium]
MLRSDRDTAPARSASTDPELLMRLEELSRAVANLRGALARCPASVDRSLPVNESGSSPAEDEAQRTLHEAMLEVVEDSDPCPSQVGTAATSNAAPLEEVKMFDNWWNDRDLRRKWILTPQSEFLRRFGLPESANAGGGVETWAYTVEYVDPETGETQRLKKTATFSIGRLMHVQ